MEVTDRSDVGADLHRPQRDSAGHANPGFSMIFYVRDGDVVVHYDLNDRAVVGWSVARGPVGSAPTLWSSHRASVRQRLGSDLREQPGWWVDLEGPFLIEPISLAALRERGSQILTTITATVPAGARPYAPFFGYGSQDELRPIQYYLTKLPMAVASLLPLLTVTQSLPRPAETVGTQWREPWAIESAELTRHIEVDIEIVERGIRGHVETERNLATALRSLGIEPKSPAASDPNFDLVFDHRGVLYVAEIKSTTNRNEERQLRLGLGQVLRYRSLLTTASSRPVRAMLVPERTPRDASWFSTCADAGVALLSGEQLTEDLPTLLQRGGE
jgi:hypothetical protein